MRTMLILSALAALLTMPPVLARKAKEKDQCEIKYVQAYMDEDCE